MNGSSALFRNTALILCIALPVQQAAFAVPAKRQSPTPPAHATLAVNVPDQIGAAHTVFLANSGADPRFPIDSTRAFNHIFADLQARGRYQLVTSPAQADLIFQLRGLAPNSYSTDANGNAYSYTTPAFRLTIVDPKTNITLWTVDSPVTVGGRRKTFDHWVSIAETNLVSRIQVLAGQPLTAAESANLTTVPKNHYRRNVIISAAVIGAGVAGGLILHHEFENGLANQKSQQDAFCKANNIPLSECAGG